MQVNTAGNIKVLCDFKCQIGKKRKQRRKKKAIKAALANQFTKVNAPRN